jgi:hypothetical protein
MVSEEQRREHWGRWALARTKAAVLLRRRAEERRARRQQALQRPAAAAEWARMEAEEAALDSLSDDERQALRRLDAESD